MSGPVADVPRVRLVSVGLSPNPSQSRDTFLLYEREPAVKLGTSRVISAQAGLTARRTDQRIEQRSSLYGLLSLAKDQVRWEAAPAAQFH